MTCGWSVEFELASMLVLNGHSRFNVVHVCVPIADYWASHLDMSKHLTQAICPKPMLLLQMNFVFLKHMTPANRKNTWALVDPLSVCIHNSKNPISSLCVNAKWPSIMPVPKVKQQLSTPHTEWSSCLFALQVHDCVVVDGARNLPNSQQDWG